MYKKNPISPYPNPFNPVSSDPNYRKTNVKFSLEYEEGEKPCFALMKVYNIIGQVVDLVVSRACWQWRPYFNVGWQKFG